MWTVVSTDEEGTEGLFLVREAAVSSFLLRLTVAGRCGNLD